MNLPIVPFDVANDLKELGFDWRVTSDFDIYQAEVVKWLRDIYDIHIQPSYCVFYDALYQHHVGYRLNIIFGGICPMNYILSNEELNVKYNGSPLNGHGIVFDTYETTELEGIKEAIKYLKNEGIKASKD